MVILVDDFAEVIEDLLPEGWSVHDPEMGIDCLLECSHGHVIEQDGRCPEGCVSPLPW
jgi:hypothetical protein